MTRRQRLAELLASPAYIDPQFAHTAAANTTDDDGDASPWLEVRRQAYADAGLAIETRAGQIVARLADVAILPVFGTIDHRTTYYGTSSEQLGAAVDQLAADDSVAAILLDIDSGGGAAFGTPEAAAKIRAARSVKTVEASANAYAASAAYYFASAAGRINITPSGKVGSIGVFMMHVDYSRALDNAGWTVTMVSAGEFKTEGNPYEPISGDALDYLRTEVETYYRTFVEDVAAGRGTTTASVEQDFGQGRMMTAAKAKTAGLVDGIESFDVTLARLAAQSGGNGRNAAARHLANRRKLATLQRRARLS